MLGISLAGIPVGKQRPMDILLDSIIMKMNLLNLKWKHMISCKLYQECLSIEQMNYGER